MSGAKGGEGRIVPNIRQQIGAREDATLNSHVPLLCRNSMYVKCASPLPCHVADVLRLLRPGRVDLLNVECSVGDEHQV